jgi:hypothetical protein
VVRASSFLIEASIVIHNWFKGLLGLVV